mmetsp:Transcript_59631/g.141899  ORF Transcript_59631/g.141899 Transcript_59631/m.141899 type:complete len:110 (+) Transcript_59631:638-967(+)
MCLSSPQVLRRMFAMEGGGPQVMGMPIFDRCYPGQKALDSAQKWCLKVLLSRGALLGDARFVPQKNKLLKKIETEAFLLWVDRYFHSASVAGMVLLDHVQIRIRQFLFA